MGDKILSQSGISLADSYDVEGSQVRIEELEASEIHLVHEMGATIAMERMQAEIVSMTAAAVLQNVSFQVTLNPITQSVARILGIVVTVDVTSRLVQAAVTARDPNTALEFPLWVWDGTNEDGIRFDNLGTGLATQLILRPRAEYIPMPISLYGTDLTKNVSQIRFRGTTSGFGAGDITLVAAIYSSFIDAPGALSSKGVPVPSW